MERVTKTTLNERAANLNRRLRPSGRHVQWQGRNGYVCLDEYEGTACVRTITCGTKREIADFLHAMMVGIDLFCVEAPESFGKGAEDEALAQEALRDMGVHDAS